MDESELRILAMHLKESETVKLKTAVTDDLAKEIIAFANTADGQIYIGVQEDGTVTGLSDPDDSALRISHIALDAIRPNATRFLRCEPMHLDGKSVLRLEVQRGTERPYYLASKGMRPEGVYVRQGFSSAPATATAIRQMIKDTGGDRFEDLRSLEQNLTFVAAQKEFAESNLAFGEAPMKTLGLIGNDGLYTNLALLLSDQCTHTIKAAVFSGKTPERFKDRKEFSGSLFTQIDEIYRFIGMYNGVGSTFSGLRRIDRPSHPEEAIREALLNMVVHREYGIRASSLVSIYEDRIEFTNVGGLVSGLTLNDALSGLSVCRNENLAQTFYRLRLVEAYGTGLRKIRNAYADSPVKPQILVTENAFHLTLPNRNADSTEPKLVAESRALPSASATLDAPLKENTLFSPQVKQRLVALAKVHGALTRSAAQVFLSTSPATCGRLLRQMVQEGLLVMQGKGRSVFYVPRTA